MSDATSSDKISEADNGISEVPILSIVQDTTKKITKCFGEENAKKRQHRMSPSERHVFIKWMFDNFDTFDQSKARWTLAKEITTKYRNLTNQSLNIDWVAALLKYGICQFEDKSFGFKENIGFTVDDLCRTPSLIRSIKLD